ncbi:hypothetical protein L1987_04115 [Smallanthus sonchifolius]|uniref:Uncharacterized protein n=1 Tax=Smallanthus sonchifolius TaxID=185202 RepID=A0ACB9KCI1_9ASTR|nr:hypothetical protein L1987_04115 [Smallanthus sonchifolius]
MVVPCFPISLARGCGATGQVQVREFARLNGRRRWGATGQGTNLVIATQESLNLESDSDNDELQVSENASIGRVLADRN